MAITPPSSYIANTSLLDWDDFSNVWDKLGDFWDWVSEKDITNVMWKSWNVLTSSLEGFLSNHQYDYSFVSTYYWGYVTAQYPLEIEISDDTRVPGTAHSYYVDPSIRSIHELTSSLVRPTTSYYLGPAPDGQFSFSTGIRDSEYGIVTFYDGSYWLPESIWTDDSFSPSRQWISLWATAWVPKAADEAIGHFGSFINYGPARKSEFRTMMDIMNLWGIQLFGPVCPNLRLGVYIHNDWPVSLWDGKVDSITATRVMIKTRTKGTYYVDNLTGLPFQLPQADDVWVPINVGDTIPENTPLVEACRIIDIVIDPMYWIDYPVGAAEKYHTFVCWINGDLPFDTSSGNYSVDWIAIRDFIERNKPIGDKPYYIIGLDVDCIIDENGTSLFPLTQACAISEDASYGLSTMIFSGIQTNETTYGVLLNEPIVAIAYDSNSTLYWLGGIWDLDEGDPILFAPVCVLNDTDLDFTI